MHTLKKAQISYLKADEAPTEMQNKYTNFADVFLPKLAMELPKYGISNHAIELIDYWQPPYGLIYSLEHVELEILKAYIKNNLANSFIKPSKSPAKASFFFHKKLDSSLKLYVDYWGLNNLVIKNWYPLFLVEKSLNWLGRGWRFTQLDLTNAYHQIRIREGNK